MSTRETVLSGRISLHTGEINQLPPAANEPPDSYENIGLNTAMMASYGIAAPVSKRPNYITYLSPPLEENIRVWGPVSFTLYASTTEEVTSDWSFFIKMGEMVPEVFRLTL